MNDTLLNPETPVEPKSYLEALTAPGGKFDRTKYQSEAEMYEAIAKGKWHADSALTVKERAFDDVIAEHTTLRETMNTQASLQELIDQLRNPPAQTNTPTGPEVVQPKTMDPKDLESLIDNRFESNLRQRKEQENFNTAKSKLVERYGPNYSTAISEQLEDLGMSQTEFDQMARTNPKLFERTFLPPHQTEDFQSPIRSTNRIQPKAEKRTWSYYQQMKKDNFRGYSDPKTQLQLMKDYAELGKEFEDGDFHRFN